MPQTGLFTRRRSPIGRHLERLGPGHGKHPLGTFGDTRRPSVCIWEGLHTSPTLMMGTSHRGLLKREDRFFVGTPEADFGDELCDQGQGAVADLRCDQSRANDWCSSRAASRAVISLFAYHDKFETSSRPRAERCTAAEPSTNFLQDAPAELSMLHPKPLALEPTTITALYGQMGCWPASPYLESTPPDHCPGITLWVFAVTCQYLHHYRELGVTRDLTSCLRAFLLFLE